MKKSELTTGRGDGSIGASPGVLLDKWSGLLCAESCLTVSGAVLKVLISAHSRG